MGVYADRHGLGGDRDGVVGERRDEDRYSGESYCEWSSSFERKVVFEGNEERHAIIVRRVLITGLA